MFAQQRENSNNGIDIFHAVHADLLQPGPVSSYDEVTGGKPPVVK
jgi:hypothetical protein